MEMTPLRKSQKTRIPSEPWKSFAKALSFPTFPQARRRSILKNKNRILRKYFLQNLTHTTAADPA